MNLFTPVTLGLMTLENRILMAPLTRMRASDEGVPGPLAAEYYAQRTSAGLIISEATQISPLGKGYPATPGIYSDAQVAAWRTVTDNLKSSSVVNASYRDWETDRKSTRLNSSH